MVANIQNDAQPHNIIDPVYFPIKESANLSEAEGRVTGTAFSGITDQEIQGEQKEEDPYFYYGEQDHGTISTDDG